MKYLMAMGAAAIAAAAPALATTGQATTADGHSFASTCAGTTYGSGITQGEVILGGISNASQSCSYATSVAPGGTASVTSSFAAVAPVVFHNSASASVAAGAIHLAASNTGANTAYFPGAQAVGGWNEQFTLNNGPIGTAGIWVFGLHVSGTLSATGAYPAAAEFDLAVFQNYTRLSHYDAPAYAAFLANNPAMAYDPENFYQFDQGETWAIEDVGANRLVTIDQIVSFAVPFVYGTAFTLGFYGKAIAVEDSYGTGTDANGSTADFAHTIKWVDKGFVVAADGSGPHSTSFALTSLSGFDYSPAIPEPATWGLMVVGFAAVGAMARRGRAAVVAA